MHILLIYNSNGLNVAMYVRIQVYVQNNNIDMRHCLFYVTALKHSPSKRKSISRPLRPLEGDFDSTGKLN